MKEKSEIVFEVCPSFHNYATIRITQRTVSIELLPRFKSLEGLDMKENLQVADFKKLKELISDNVQIKRNQHHTEEAQIELNKVIELKKAIHKILAVPEDDDRLLLDGIQVNCTYKNGKDFYSGFKFSSPNHESRYYHLTKKLFDTLLESLKSVRSLDYVELIGSSYFGFYAPWKLVNADPPRVRILGSLSIHEKEHVESFFENLPANEHIVFDFTNFSSMGTRLFESFRKLEKRGFFIHWLLDEENEWVLNLIKEMNLDNNRVYFDEDALAEGLRK